MGSWSVYCGISQVAITAGDKCVLLPLKVNRNSEGYLPYLPATLPIFGEYDDYGGLENIEKNANTELIEKHFNTTIDKFAHFFTRGCICTDEDDFPKELLENQEIKEWKFMFIDRKVYDFMSTHLSGDVKGHLEFGNEKILELLGFKHIGFNDKNDTYDPKRYTDEWEFDGKKFYGDGTWIHYDKNKAIFYFKSSHSKEHSLVNVINVPEDKMWLGNKAMWQLWKYLSPKKQKEELGWVIGRGRWESDLLDEIDDLTSIGGRLFKTLQEKGEDVSEFLKLKAPKNLKEAYIQNIATFGDTLAELVTIRHNMHCMSGYFAPYVNYLTPQCGEPENHHVLLKKFTEINMEKLVARGWEDEEDENE
jgi:hypothetical protein